MAKWRNFSFRNTSNGSALWNGGGINLGTDVDPNDVNNTTTVVTGPAPAYPTLSSDGVNSYGRSSGVADSGTDATPTNAGSNTLLGGAHNMNSTAQAIQIDGQAGTYDLRIALNGSAGCARTAVIVFDGSTSTLNTDLGSLTIGFWAASTVFSASFLIVSKTDKTIWKVTAGGGGTSSTTEPSGAGPTFTDGGLTWTKQSRSALAVYDSLGALTGTQIWDTSAAIVAASAWGANTAPLTISGNKGNSLTFLRPNGVGFYVRQISLRLQTATLVDVTFLDETGAANPGSSPSVWANQPSGYNALKIVATNGASVLANFSLGGALASYFTLTTVNGTEVWLVANGTPLPDALAGSRTLTVIQTDVASIGSPHTTSFTPTVISSQGKPTDSTPAGKITTQTFLARKTIRDITDSVWAGYTGQGFASDQLATGGSDLATKLAALTPDGTSWYRIRLGAGTYTGLTGSAIHLDFGTGGLLIEPNSGDDPEWSCGYSDLQIHNVHIRNLKIPTDKTLTGAINQFQFNDPGSTGINGHAGKFNVVKITGCRIGILYGAGNDVTQWSTKAGGCAAMNHGDSLEFTNNIVKDAYAPILLNGVRRIKVTDNDFQGVFNDLIGFTNALDTTSTIGVFADNNAYLDFSRNMSRNEPDYVGYVNGKHADSVQIYRNMRDYPAWSVGATYAVSGHTLNMNATPPRVYIVASITTGVTGSAPGPTSTASGIVDGGVTWNYVGDAVLSDEYILMENNCLASEGVLAGQNARQFFLDSNDGRGCNVFLTAINNVQGSGSSYGVQFGQGVANAEFNTFASFPRMNAGDTILSANIHASGNGKIRVFHNAVRAASASLGGGTTAIWDEVILDWSAGAIAPNRPGDYMTGPFATDGSGRWTYATLTDDGSNSTAAFDAQFRSIMMPLTGTAGILQPASSGGGNTPWRGQGHRW